MTTAEPKARPDRLRYRRDIFQSRTHSRFRRSDETVRNGDPVGCASDGDSAPAREADE